MGRRGPKKTCRHRWRPPGRDFPVVELEPPAGWKRWNDRRWLEYLTELLRRHQITAPEDRIQLELFAKWMSIFGKLSGQEFVEQRGKKRLSPDFVVATERLARYMDRFGMCPTARDKLPPPEQLISGAILDFGKYNK